MSFECEVLLFAGIREALGKDAVSVQLEEGASVGDLMVALGSQHPEIAARRKSLGVAVNQAMAATSQNLAPGDEVALIPPLGGG